MALLSTVSRSTWNLEMLVFVEGGKPEYPEKNPRSRDENQQQTQPTYDAETGNRTRATLVGGECSHHCAIPAPIPAPHKSSGMDQNVKPQTLVGTLDHTNPQFYPGEWLELLLLL